MILEKKTDIGLYRKNNEDFVHVCSHPDDPNMHLLMVADGMGGRKNGEIASYTIVNSLYNYFIMNDAELFKDYDLLQTKLTNFIGYVNEEIIKRYGENTLGTTLCMAIVNDDKTLILNIGDSRCYIYKDKLMQVTEDDSEVYAYYKNNLVKKDDLKFFSVSNLITRCVGLNNELCKCSFKIIDTDYKLLLIVTDGVTDILNDSKIEQIIENTPSKNILDSIIREAVYNDQKLEIPEYLKEKYKEYLYKPMHGKDNASGAIYIKEN